MIRAIMKLGITCTADDRSLTLNRARDNGVDLGQMSRSGPAPTRQPYLDGGRGLKIVFLHHAYTPSAPVHCFSIVLPDGAIKLHVVDPATRRQPIPRFEAQYAELLERKEEHRGFSTYNYPVDIRTSTDYHSNEATALRAISRELGLLENKAYTLVLSSTRDTHYFTSMVPKLAKFPILRMPSSKPGHVLDVFPWQSALAKKLLSRYLSLSAWLHRTIAQASHYDVPIGHIEDDQPLFFSDIDFARRLVAQDMVLWWSPGERPDLGGYEDDALPSDELVNPEFTSPGIYSRVCLSIQVRNLAVNSVLQSSIVNELEGCGGTTGFDTTYTIDDYSSGDAQATATLSDSNLPPQTFMVLKHMVRSWLTKKASDPDGPASLTIDHFWRWISSSSSHMFDSCIQRFVHGLMRKTFIQLLAEFKRLGSNLVYADFTRLVLVTSKPPGTANAYATYLLTAVTSHELFKHVYLRTDRFYDFLAFMDPANEGGVLCEDPLAIEPPKQLSVFLTWNIKKFLPPAVQDHFKAVIKYFIVEMHKISRAADASRTPLRLLQNGAPDATQRDTNRVKEIDAIKSFISQRLTRKMLQTVASIQEDHRRAILEDDESNGFTFPILPGSYLNLTDPALEFVKFTCAIFGLAHDYQIEIGLLKRNLLELVGVKEFSEAANFHNPCDPLKLSMVTCQYCDYLRDFDFCRDDDLFPTSVEQVRWTCPECSCEYDRTAIEFSLIQMLHRLERSFSQQDLKCSKCKQIRSDNVSKHCQCSGSYELTIGKVEVRRKLRTIVNVAIVHKLNRLKVRKRVSTLIQC